MLIKNAYKKKKSVEKAFSGSWSFFGHKFCPSKNFKSIVLIKNGLLAQKECRIWQISSLVYWKSETSKMKDQIIPKNFLVGAPKCFQIFLPSYFGETAGWWVLIHYGERHQFLQNSYPNSQNECLI